MVVWDDFITQRDRLVYERGGYHATQDYGEHPALLVVDVTYRFVGAEPAPILESVEVWPSSCGEEGWQAIEAIRNLLDIVRERNIPVLYTANRPVREGDYLSGLWRRNRDHEKPAVESGITGWEIVSRIAPEKQDIVVTKDMPSAFFGTPLALYLNRLKVDTLFVTGCTTSGCVRATVVDGFSLGYNVKVVQEATFDRGQASHAISLFDMDSKYADVISIEDALSFMACFSPSRRT